MPLAEKRKIKGEMRLTLIIVLLPITTTIITTAAERKRQRLRERKTHNRFPDSYCVTSCFGWVFHFYRALFKRYSPHPLRCQCYKQQLKFSIYLFIIFFFGFGITINKQTVAPNIQRVIFSSYHEHWQLQERKNGAL